MIVVHGDIWNLLEMEKNCCILGESNNASILCERLRVREFNDELIK